MSTHECMSEDWSYMCSIFLYWCDLFHPQIANNLVWFLLFCSFFHYDSVYQWNGYSDRLDDIMKSIGQGSYCEKEILGWINWLNFDQTLSISVSIMLKYPPRFIDNFLFRHHADTFFCKSKIWVHCIARKIFVFRFQFYTLCVYL